MKICLHTIWEISHNYIGGTERFLINFSKELQLLGHDPFIVCTSKTRECIIEGVKVLGRYSEKLEDYPYFSSKFIKNEIIGETYSEDSLKRLSVYTLSQIEGIEADIFHFNSFISVSYLKGLENLNCVITNHENRREYDWYWGEGFFDLFKSLVNTQKTNLHKVNNLFTPSNHYAIEFSKEFNLPVKNIQLGVSLDYFKPSKKKEGLRLEYDLKDEIILLLPSRFQPHQKGHDIALKACKLLKDNGVNFIIIFTGVKKSSEKYKSVFDDLVFNYGLQKNVKVVTFPDINEAYQGADIVISPERFCSYGLSISESLALGIPTVLSDIPTYVEIAKKYSHASFFKSESAEDLHDKIRDVIQKNEIRNHDSAADFRCDNDIRDCAKNYYKVYRETLNRSTIDFD